MLLRPILRNGRAFLRYNFGAEFRSIRNNTCVQRKSSLLMQTALSVAITLTFFYYLSNTSFAPLESGTPVFTSAVPRADPFFSAVSTRAGVVA